MIISKGATRGDEIVIWKISDTGHTSIDEVSSRYHLRDLSSPHLSTKSYPKTVNTYPVSITCHKIDYFTDVCTGFRVIRLGIWKRILAGVRIYNKSKPMYPLTLGWWGALRLGVLVHYSGKIFPLQRFVVDGSHETGPDSGCRASTVP